MNFMEKIAFAAKKNNSLVCVGLDPDLAKLPECVKSAADPIFEFNKQIIDATKDFVCAYKPQAAYYAGQDCDESLKKSLVRLINKNTSCASIFGRDWLLIGDAKSIHSWHKAKDF